jgi:hypothetical protein
MFKRLKSCTVHMKPSALTDVSSSLTASSPVEDNNPRRLEQASALARGALSALATASAARTGMQPRTACIAPKQLERPPKPHGPRPMPPSPNEPQATEDIIASGASSPAADLTTAQAPNVTHRRGHATGTETRGARAHKHPVFDQPELVLALAQQSDDAKALVTLFQSQGYPLGLMIDAFRLLPENAQKPALFESATGKHAAGLEELISAHVSDASLDRPSYDMAMADKSAWMAARASIPGVRHVHASYAMECVKRESDKSAAFKHSDPRRVQATLEHLCESTLRDLRLPEMTPEQRSLRGHVQDFLTAFPSVDSRRCVEYLFYSSAGTAELKFLTDHFLAGKARESVPELLAACIPTILLSPPDYDIDERKRLLQKMRAPFEQSGWQAVDVAPVVRGLIRLCDAGFMHGFAGSSELRGCLSAMFASPNAHMPESVREDIVTRLVRSRGGSEESREWSMDSVAKLSRGLMSSKEGYFIAFNIGLNLRMPTVHSEGYRRKALDALDALALSSDPSVSYAAFDGAGSALAKGCLASPELQTQTLRLMTRLRDQATGAYKPILATVGIEHVLSALDNGHLAFDEAQGQALEFAIGCKDHWRRELSNSQLDVSRLLQSAKDKVAPALQATYAHLEAHLKGANSSPKTTLGSVRKLHPLP